MAVSGTGIPGEVVVVRESGDLGVPLGGVSGACV